jgi:two-component system, cell cycle response regulator DivK
MAKILYVEDNEDNVHVLKRRLERAGFEVVVAPDGEQGLAVAVDQRPDLILMDLRLPVLDGWQATRRLKDSEETQIIPVIALSAQAMPDDREKALEAGCDDYDASPSICQGFWPRSECCCPREPSREAIRHRHLGRRRHQRQSLHAAPSAQAARYADSRRRATAGRPHGRGPCP